MLTSLTAGHKFKFCICKVEFFNGPKDVEHFAKWECCMSHLNSWGAHQNCLRKRGSCEFDVNIWHTYTSKHTHTHLYSSKRAYTREKVAHKFGVSQKVGRRRRLVQQSVSTKDANWANGTLFIWAYTLTHSHTHSHTHALWHCNSCDTFYVS